MTRTTAVGRRGPAAALVVLALIGGPVGGAAAAPADDAGRPEATVQPGMRWLPRQETLLTAGGSGYLALSGSTYGWVGDSGTTTPAPLWQRANRGMWALKAPNGPPIVKIGDFPSGDATTTIAVPDGQTYLEAFTADAILTGASDGTGLHVVSAAGAGQVTDRTAAGIPAGATFDKVLDLGGQFAALSLRVDGAPHIYLLDFATASAREVFASVPGVESVVIGGDRVLAGTTAHTTAYGVRLDDPSGAVEETPYPEAARVSRDFVLPIPDGDRVLLQEYDTDHYERGGALWSVPVGGGAATLALSYSVYTHAVAPDGSVLVVGGSGPADWAVRRIAAGGTVSAVTSLAPVPAKVFGLAYSAGRLVYSTDTGAYDPVIARDVTPGSVPAVSSPSELWMAGPGPGARLQGLGNGSVAFVSRKGQVISPVPGNMSGYRTVMHGTVAATAVLDGDGDDLLLDVPSTGRQAVGSLGNDYDTFTRGRDAAAVWDRTVWVAGTTPGTLRPYNLRSLSYGAAVRTGAPCADYTELQADGRWLYWSCGTTAGVYDRANSRNIPVPAGQALLGDGFVVRHAGDRLVMTDVHTDAAVTSDVAGLPAATQTDDRGITWTVDKYAGGLAYLDTAQVIHVIPSLGVPLSSRAPAGRDYDGDGVGDLLTFTPDGNLNLRPGNRTGGVGPSTGDFGSWPTDLTFVPTDDLDGDGCNDLLVRDPSGTGTLVRYLGTCAGPPLGASYPIGGGWNVYNSLVSPGDLNGDGRADLLGRTASGDLYFYAGTVTGVFAPRVRIGFGYQAYSLMAGVHDLNGDGFGDLLARDKAGVLWRYDGDGKGGLKARVRIGAGWNAYNAVVGVGDINGDGHNDLVARDGHGDLWRYNGLGNGLFAPRVKIGWGWQAYKSLL